MSESYQTPSLERLRDALAVGEERVCGDSARWIRESVLENLNRLLANPQRTDADVAAFALGAIRFVTDSSGADSDNLSGCLLDIYKEYQR